MTYLDKSCNLRIELDQKGCDLTELQIKKMESTLGTLHKLVRTFPVSNLYVTVVHYARSNDYHVKTSLALCGRTLCSGDRDLDVHPAFERCIRKLVQKVSSYKSRMQQESELAKQESGTHQMVTPSGQLDLNEIQSAVEEMDYRRFRSALSTFESSLRKRVGRWLQRYPEIGARLEGDFQIDDLVEEVFLNAFEEFPEHSRDVPPGDWLEQLIDPSVQAILQFPDREFANISFARTMRETEKP